MSFKIPVSGYSDNALLFTARMYCFLKAAKSLVCVAQLAGKIGDWISPNIPLVDTTIKPFFNKLESYYPSFLRVNDGDSLKVNDDSSADKTKEPKKSKDKEFKTSDLIKLAFRHGVFAISGLAALEYFVKEPSSWYNIVLSRISPFLINPKCIDSLFGRVAVLSIPLQR